MRGQEPFAYFGLGRHSGFSKVSRCKSETASRRTRSNGYVPKAHKKRAVSKVTPRHR